MSNKEQIITILEETNRPGITDLIQYMQYNDFFTAPCSSMYHLCREGGLAEHSLSVYQFGFWLLESPSFAIAEQYKLSQLHPDSNPSWSIVSLLHDIGKSTYRNKPNYTPNILKSGKISDSKPYETNKDRLFISHEIVSLQIISKFIELTEEEEFAILYHNGMYTASGRDIQGKERPLQQLLHFCDMWCSRFIETKEVAE